MEKMKIEIWSDIACPYCYIGKRKLEEALEKFPHSNEIEIIWHSYELSPELPKQALSQSFESYYAKQNNYTTDEAKLLLEKMTARAKRAGLDYRFDKLIVANTSDALRLAKLAAKHNKANEAEEILFKAYFTEGRDISDQQTLIDLGKRIGLPEAEITAMLNSDLYLSDIKADMQYSEEQLKLEFIPFYLLNNKDVIQGSLAEEEYLEALDKAYTNWKENGGGNGGGTRTKGRTCSPDGTCSL